MENLLVRRDGSVAVLDWTSGQIQDRRLDLGWTLLLMGMYDGWAMREALLGEYRRLTGGQSTVSSTSRRSPPLAGSSAC